jgi:proline dehydrogenase
MKEYIWPTCGMSDNISYNLADHNYNIAKYFYLWSSKDVMPYLIRRAEEKNSGRTNQS